MPPRASAPDARDRVLGWRDRLLASPRFQRAAATFMPTRWIARRRARALFDLVAGFVYSQTLAALVRLQVFEQLADGPRDAEALATAAGLSPEAARRLLDAGVALRLLEHRHGGRYGLGVLGAPLSRPTTGEDGLPGVGDAIRAMVEHHAALYADLSDPVALLRGAAGATQLGAVWPYAAAAEPAQLGALDVRGYSMLMAASQPLVAEEILGAWPFTRHRRLLDVGGGEGAFVQRAGARAPRLELSLFDLPAVAARAELRLARAGLGPRASVHGGDFRVDALPDGADLVTLIRVLHDHPDDVVITLLRRVRAAIAPGGTLLVAEPMAGTRGAEPVGDAYFGLYLWAMGSGRPRTAGELTALIEAAGFRAVRPLRNAMPMLTRLLVATADDRSAN